MKEFLSHQITVGDILFVMSLGGCFAIGFVLYVVIAINMGWIKK